MKSKILINVTLLLIMLAGCASHEVKDLAVKSADDYASREEVAGVTVAIETYETKEKVEEAFTINLTEEGIVPILLVMENQSDVSFYLLKENIELTDTQGNVKIRYPPKWWRRNSNTIKWCMLYWDLESSPICLRKRRIRKCFRTGGKKNSRQKRY